MGTLDDLSQFLIPETAANPSLTGNDPAIFGRIAPEDDLLTDAERQALANPNWEDEADFDPEEDLGLEAVTPEDEAAAADTAAQMQAAQEENDAQDPAKAATQIVDPAIFQQQLDQLNAKLADIDRQHEDGEISEAEWRSMSRNVDREVGRVEAQHETARAAYEEWTANLDRQWDAALTGFKASHPHLVSGEHQKAFSQWVESITGNPLWASKPYPVQLKEAAEQYARFVGNPNLAKASGKTQTPDPAPRQGQRRSQRPQNPPVTLGGIPASDSANAGMSDFQDIEAAMDAGDGARAEALIARLSPEQAERYLAGF